MKGSEKGLARYRAILACICVLTAAPAKVQAFATIFTFTNPIDGIGPQGITLSGSTLYGATLSGGISNAGTIFRVNTDGSGAMTLHHFFGSPTDGANPKAALEQSGSRLFGTASTGGFSGAGTVFAINTDGTSYTTLHNFISAEGATPTGALIVSSNRLYGTASAGGSSGSGTLFALNTEGTVFKILHDFSSGTTSDGAHPQGALVLCSNTIYGTTASGTVFAVNTDGSDFRTLHTVGGVITGSLVLWGVKLYGTTLSGGAAYTGTIFALNIDGTGFHTVHSFSSTYSLLDPPYTVFNFDGSYPNSLILLGKYLYGMTSGLGAWGGGSLFTVNLVSEGFSLLDMPTDNNTRGPQSTGLAVGGNAVYTATSWGGSSGNGTILALLPPPLTKKPREKLQHNRVQ
jgi:uncharacterized repeat protein (TIGR03803 family)